MRNPDQTDADMFWLSGQYKWCPRSSETSAVGKWNSKCGLRLPFILMLNPTCLLILMGMIHSMMWWWCHRNKPSGCGKQTYLLSVILSVAWSWSSVLKFCDVICMVQPLWWSFLPLCFGSSADDTPSLSLQDQETLSLDAAAESTPLSSRGSYKGTSADSSHVHLGPVEMLSLHRSDPLPQKLLAHLAEAGRADLCSLSPYMLRLSGAGFAYYAPGPETSVWPRAWTLYVYESHRLNHTVYPTMCDQALHLKDQGHLEQKYKHAHTCQPPCWAHHVHFSWTTPEWTTL